MNDIIEVENIVDRSCIRVIHLMANRELDISALQKYGPPGSLTIDTKFQTGTWHLWAKWPYRGRLDIVAAVSDQKKFRRLVVWSLDGYGSMRDAIHDAFIYFWRYTKFQPGYCFFSKLPSGVKLGDVFEGMELLEADWMLEKAVAVGGRL